MAMKRNDKKSYCWKGFPDVPLDNNSEKYFPCQDSGNFV